MIARKVIAVGAALALAACGASANEAAVPTSPEAGGGTGRLEGLTITLELEASSVHSGSEVGSSLHVRNDSGKAVIDPRCLIASGRFALMPADEASAELWLQPVVDCSGPFEMPDGFVDRFSGPRFPARTKHGKALPPGDYIATLEIDGYSEPLTQPVQVTD
jgi:hypothetical protein